MAGQVSLRVRAERVLREAGGAVDVATVAYEIGATPRQVAHFFRTMPRARRVRRGRGYGDRPEWEWSRLRAA